MCVYAVLHTGTCENGGVCPETCQPTCIECLSQRICLYKRADIISIKQDTLTFKIALLSLVVNAQLNQTYISYEMSLIVNFKFNSQLNIRE